MHFVDGLFYLSKSLMLGFYLQWTVCIVALILLVLYKLCTATFEHFKTEEIKQKRNSLIFFDINIFNDFSLSSQLYSIFPHYKMNLCETFPPW